MEENIGKSHVGAMAQSMGNYYPEGSRRARRGDKLSLLGRLKDINLNKSGTIGTEPIGKFNRKGEFTKGTEFKLGKLGAVFVPDIKPVVKRYASKVKKGVVKAITTPARKRYGNKKVDEALKEIYK